MEDESGDLLTGCATCTSNEENYKNSDFAGIRIYGSDSFQNKIESSLKFLKSCSPTDLLTVDKYLDNIFEDVRIKDPIDDRYISIATAYVPNPKESFNEKGEYVPVDRQNYNKSISVNVQTFQLLRRPTHDFLFAGVLIHEARHHWQFVNSEKDEYPVTEIDATTTEKNFYLKTQNCADVSDKEFQYLITWKDKMINYYKNCFLSNTTFC